MTTKSKPAKKLIFNDEVAIVPYVIADCVVREAAMLFDHLGADAFDDAHCTHLCGYLADRAETVAQANGCFRRRILGPKGVLGRDRLYALMRHALAAKFLELHGERVRDAEHRATFVSYVCGVDPSTWLDAIVVSP